MISLVQHEEAVRTLDRGIHGYARGASLSFSSRPTCGSSPTTLPYSPFIDRRPQPRWLSKSPPPPLFFLFIAYAPASLSPAPPALSSNMASSLTRLSATAPPRCLSDIAASALPVAAVPSLPRASPSATRQSKPLLFSVFSSTLLLSSSHVGNRSNLRAGGSRCWWWPSAGPERPHTRSAGEVLSLNVE